MGHNFIWGTMILYYYMVTLYGSFYYEAMSFTLVQYLGANWESMEPKMSVQKNLQRCFVVGSSSHSGLGQVEKMRNVNNSNQRRCQL